MALQAAVILKIDDSFLFNSARKFTSRKEEEGTWSSKMMHLMNVCYYNKDYNLLEI